MSILGTLIGQVSGSFAGSGLVNSISYATHIHSLPATNPESLILEQVSLATVGLVMAPPKLLAIGGNASALTIGIAQGSAVSQPVTAYKVTYAVWFSKIR